MPSRIFLSTFHRRLPRFFCWWSVALPCFLLAPAAWPGVIVDLNHNGMSDIWEWLHGAYGLDPSADPDGDGMSNLQESIAGTNPIDANSVFRIQTAAVTGTNVSVTVASALGKFYQLQSTVLLGGGAGSAWLTETGLVARTGTNITLAAPAGAGAKFFRVVVSDVDTDGDGVNDWEEYQLGLDPFNPYSNGQLDANGLPMTDYAYVTGRLASQNVVSILATGPAAMQPDPGQDSSASGMFTLARGGFPLNDITVQLGAGGPGPGFATAGVDALPLPPAVEFPSGVSAQQIPVTPLSNPNLLAPVIAMLRLAPGTGYALGASSNASVVIYPSSTPNGAGLTGQYFDSSSTIYSNRLNFDPANLIVTRVDPGLNFVWGPGSVPNLSNSQWSVRWTGQVQPQFSETYYFDARTDDGLKLWVNDQLIIDHWVSSGAVATVGSISLQGGVRYDLRMDYLQAGGSALAQLSWYSPSQPKQIIPANRLYPSAAGAAPGAVTSPTTAVGFAGQPFAFTVTGADSPGAYTASGLPPGLSLNPTTGVISGTLGTAGNYQIILTSSNAAGVSASALNLQLLNPAAAVTREIWTGVPGVNITDIPLNTPAGLTNTLPGLHGLADYGDNYAERVRGFLTVPATGNYYFWITGSDSAEFWLSNDSDPVNKTRRAYVLPTPDSAPPPANGAGPGQWNLQPNQKSGWLSLVAGQNYYLEILHKAGVGSGDNWAVGWLQDPVGTGSAPGGPVPGYLLSPYQPPPLSRIAGTLYSANLLPDNAPGSSGSGTASLLLSADETSAIVRFAFSGLSSTATAKLIYSEPYLNNPSTLIFDLDASSPQADGSYFWPITPVGTLAAADVVEIIKEGKAYLGVNTTLHPSEPGEIDGNFIPIAGSQSFTPPPLPPAWADDSSSTDAAARFLIQATFGPSPADISNVRAMGYSNWISRQISLPVAHHLPLVLADKSADPVTPFPSALTFNAWWQESVTAPDQLRQRVAFALSEILVVSENGVLQDNAPALSSYYDTLLDHTFGNFHSLLEAVTLTAAMGLYLDMRGNDAGSIITGVHADENYAREVQQLFSVGLNRLWPDGSLVMNSQGSLVPTYDQNVVMGFASVFTGWNYFQSNQANGRLPSNWYPGANYTNAMVLVPSHHELGAKQLLDNVVLPPAAGGQTVSANPAFDEYGSQELESALDSLFNHQNVGPFLCRQLIQRLVTSNPSRGYVYRVAQVFDDNGAGVRGDLSAVIRAILLDYEARSPDLIAQPAYGKQREPLLRVTAPARAFPAPLPLAGAYTQNGTQIISVATAAPHRLNNGDSVSLTFTETSGRLAPQSRSYSVTVTGPSAFTVNDPDLPAGSYAQTNTTITVAIAGHGLAQGDSVYLDFTTGGGSSGAYVVSAVNSSASFNVTSPNSADSKGNCLFYKLPAAGYTQNGGTITVSVTGPHGLIVGSSVFLDFTSGTAGSGVYRVGAVPDPSHFVVGSAVSANQTQSGLQAYPQSAPPLVRSGTVSLQEGLWTLDYTDSGNSSSLAQTPLRAPTVFNFFYPNYEFPGALAAAGLTTPEFQLTSDTTVALQMNFLAGGLLNNGGNTNGLSSFASGNGSIVLDLGPWMTPQYTSTAGLPILVQGLSSLLTAGQLSAAAQSAIVGYAGSAANFPYSPTPTSTQMRDRVRAVVHLILVSPDFTIQK